MKRYLILSAVVGGLMLGSFAVRADDEKEEGNEQKVSMNDVPAAVKDTLTKEADGAKLPDNVDKETQDGKVVYEADVVINGKNYEIVVAPDGSLIHKKLDMEDSGKKGEKGEKDEKDEKK